MKKTIRILSILCLALMVISLVLTAGCILLQKPLINLIYGKSAATAPMIVPFSPLVYGVCAAVTLGLLCLVAVNKKIGIWADLVLLGVSALVLPGMNFLLNFAQNMLVTTAANARGVAAVIANSAVNNMCSYTMMPGGLGMRLALVVCGMSIVLKLLEKQQVKTL